MSTYNYTQEAEQTRIPIKNAPYYGLSKEWTYINGKLVMLEFFLLKFVISVPF